MGGIRDRSEGEREQDTCTDTLDLQDLSTQNLYG